MLDVVRLAEEMKLSCIQAIKMDALKSLRVEGAQQQLTQSEPLDECSTTTRLTQTGTEDSVVTDLISDGPDNVVQKYSKKHLREGEHLMNCFHCISIRGYKRLMTLHDFECFSNHWIALAGCERSYFLVIVHDSNTLCAHCTRSESAQDSTAAVDCPRCNSASHISSTRSNTESASTKEFKDNGAYTSRKSARKEARKLKTGFKKTAEQDAPYKEGFAPQSFDRVLLDAPCSALGLRPRLFAGQVSSHPKSYLVTLFSFEAFDVLVCESILTRLLIVEYV